MKTLLLASALILSAGAHANSIEDTLITQLPAERLTLVIKRPVDLPARRLEVVRHTRLRMIPGQSACALVGNARAYGSALLASGTEIGVQLVVDGSTQTVPGTTFVIPTAPGLALSCVKRLLTVDSDGIPQPMDASVLTLRDLRQAVEGLIDVRFE